MVRALLARYRSQLSFLLIGIVTGAGVSIAITAPASGTKYADLTDTPSSDYPLINPLLACGDITDQSLGEMLSLRAALDSTIAHAQKAGVSHAAVYLRDLNNGPWLGINERENFYPSALLKVPLILAVYKEDEAHPGFLEKKITYTKPIVYTQHLLPPAEPLHIGHAYSVRELVARSIIYSDDEAAALLGNTIGFGKLAAVFSDFGLTPPTPDAEYQMPVRTFASFFRVLYNASYLNHLHSEEALEILSQSPLTNGIVEGVPHGVVVAHKFGEREVPADDGGVQLHDCGIIYAPKNPYLLCVMAQGSDASGIIELLHDIAAKTYAAMQR